jgi:hypothetical protein
VLCDNDGRKNEVKFKAGDEEDSRGKLKEQMTHKESSTRRTYVVSYSTLHVLHMYLLTAYRDKN